MSIRDELASLLDRHLSDRDNAQGCRLACGYDGDDRCEHLADAILTRFAVVELPEPAEVHIGTLSLVGDEQGSVEVLIPRDLIVSKSLGEWGSPNGLRTLAAALLAAANRAEAQA